MADTPPTYTLADDDDQDPTSTGAPAAGETAAVVSPGRRRRLLLVGVAALACCVVAPVVVIAGWVVGETAKAGKGAPTPESALTDWMFSFRDPSAVDADRYVIKERRTDLARVRAAWLAQMHETAADARVEVSGQAATEQVSGDRASIVDYYVVTQPIEGSLASYHTDALPWRAEARRSDGGWRLWSVTLPPWCGPGGYVPQCGPPTPAASTSPSSATSPTPDPSPLPSDDPLEGPRRMLRCGPEDPFREWHSCPPSRSAKTHR